MFAGIDPLGTAPAQETCLKFTEDDPVFAAVGFFNADAPLCYAEKHDTPVLGGQITDAYLARAKAPWFTLDPGAEVAPRVIDTLAKAGAFKGGKVGIVAVAADAGPAERRGAAGFEAQRGHGNCGDQRRADH